MDSFLKVLRIQLFSKFLYIAMSLCFLMKFSICDIPYLLERAPPSNQRPLFDVKYLMNASLESAPLLSLKRDALLKNSI